MRIIRGSLKRVYFKPPKGFKSRPTTDFAKEGLFNVFEHQVGLNDLKILDLFAGTGNITFEFASRDSGLITAVDNNFRCVKFIQAFSQKYNLQDTVQVLKADAIQFLGSSKSKYDIIFADPPYQFEDYNLLVESVFNHQHLNENGWLVIEHDKHHDFSNHPSFDFSKKYGGVFFSFFKHFV